MHSPTIPTNPLMYGRIEIEHDHKIRIRSFGPERNNAKVVLDVSESITKAPIAKKRQMPQV